jgi:polyisoprenyl-teichoic acid--peptidoglycan teichoic acid transferase
MSSRVTLSSDERASLLREVHASDAGARVPVRAASTPRRWGSTGGGRGGVRPPEKPPGRGRPGSPRQRRLRTTVLVLITLILIAGGLFSAKVLNVGRNALSQERSIFAQLTDLVFKGDRVLAGEKENRVNILLIAIGGEGHKGENLADTIMVVSFRPREKEVALLSIPRDLYVNIPGTQFFTKINAVHAYRENAKKGEGPLLLKEKVEDVTGLPIHYYGRVDFKAFKRIVDEVGGVDMTIPNSFFDYWHKISFPAGTEHMNGERALAYARARYVEGGEGGDFKRAARQQQLLLAIRQKVFSANTAFDLRAVSGILDALGDEVATDFELWELKRLFELARDIPKENIRSAVLSTGPNGLLVGGTEILEGKPASVIRPRAGIEQYEEIRRFAQNLFEEARRAPAPSAAAVTPSSSPAPEGSPSPSTSPTPLPSPSPSGGPSHTAETPSADVRNGTTVTGLAGRVASTLKKKSFTIPSTGNAAERGRERTIVVDLTQGKKPNSLAALLEILGIDTAVTFPASEKPSKADFLILLGTDVAEKFK